MSNSDDPFANLGTGGDRTIIRPNPAGRRSGPSPSGMPAEVPQTGYPSQPANLPPPGRVNMPIPRPGASASDDWVRTQDPRQPQFAGHAPLPEISFDELVAPNANPIMAAAGPLLMLLGRLRVALLRASFAKLMGEVSDAVDFFEKSVRAAGVADAQTQQAKYILCATADDIVQNIPTDDRHVWAQYSMLSRFFGERLGGERFFEHLDKAQAEAGTNYPVLELMYTCLALGFQGKYRHSPQGAVDLQRIQRNLYELLRRIRPRVETELSPFWRGQALAGRSGRIRVPFWAAAGFAAASIVGGFFILRYLLGDGAEAATGRVQTLHGTGAIDIQRKIYIPPKPPEVVPGRITQLQRIRTALAAEIAAGEVDADQNATRIFIHVGDKVLFASGQASVLDAFKKIAVRIAQVVDKEPGTIAVTGHTDNIKLAATSRFKDNYDLSVERAKAVAALVKPLLAEPNRVEISGRADQEPIAPNATPEGRRQNRRVDISMARTGD